MIMIPLLVVAFSAGVLATKGHVDQGLVAFAITLAAGAWFEHLWTRPVPPARRR